MAWAVLANSQSSLGQYDWIERTRRLPHRLRQPAPARSAGFVSRSSSRSFTFFGRERLGPLSQRPSHSAFQPGDSRTPIQPGLDKAVPGDGALGLRVDQADDRAGAVLVFAF